MGESETGKVCPYCDGKGYVSVVVELPPDDDPREELSRTTWVRKPCPLCDGKGRISGDDLLHSFSGQISCPLIALTTGTHSLTRNCAGISAGADVSAVSGVANSFHFVAL
jgi:RecJ-like exonuclease